MGLSSSSASNADSKALSSSYSSSASDSPRRLPTALPMAPSQPSPSGLDSSSYSSSPSPEYSSSSSCMISLSDSNAMMNSSCTDYERVERAHFLAHCAPPFGRCGAAHSPAGRLFVSLAHLHIARDRGGACLRAAQHAAHLLGGGRCGTLAGDGNSPSGLL